VSEDYLSIEQDVVRPQDSFLRPALGAVLFGVGYLGLLLAGGELRRFASAGLEVLPFAILVVLACLGEEREWARVLTIVYWSILAFGIGLAVLGFTAFAVTDPNTFKQIAEATSDSEKSRLLEELLHSDFLLRLGQSIVASIGASLLGV